MLPLNSRDYWEQRFGSGDWVQKGGRSQTREFAHSYIPRLRLDATFDGTLCDFGCGSGDGMPEYRAAFPRATLVGVDFSAEATKLSRTQYGTLAAFLCGGAEVVPECDVIVCSNVLEHVSNDTEVMAKLQSRCRRLFVVVPYLEQPLCSEHVRAYSRDAYENFKPNRIEVYACRGWSEYGCSRIRMYLLNPIHFIQGHSWRRRRRQILFEISGSLAIPSSEEYEEGDVSGSPLVGDVI